MAGVTRPSEGLERGGAAASPSRDRARRKRARHAPPRARVGQGLRLRRLGGSRARELASLQAGRYWAWSRAPGAMALPPAAGLRWAGSAVRLPERAFPAEEAVRSFGRAPGRKVPPGAHRERGGEGPGFACGPGERRWDRGREPSPSGSGIPGPLAPLNIRDGRGLVDPVRHPPLPLTTDRGNGRLESGNPVIKVDSRRENLTDLTMDEIEKVIKKLPSPKTPVPDGVSASGTLTPELDMKIVLKLETWLKKSFLKKILSNTMDSEAHEKRPPILTSSKQDIAPHIANVSEMRHYLCGCCAAFNNIAITFPIQKVLFRQQLYGIKTRDAVLQLRRDGFRNLYRGILPPLMQKTTTLALMFGLYEDLSCLLRKHISTPEFATRSLAAVLAGTTEAIFTPLERVQTLLQDHKHHDKFTNTYQAFKALKCHGIREYYRGLVPVLFRNGFSNVLFFGLRGPIKEHLPTATTHSAHLVNDFICGGLLGAMLGILFFPVNVVKTRMQSQIGGEFQSFPKVFQKIWLERDRKLTNLFRGAHLNYHRSLISWGIINATYEFLLKII
ncbi:hypothetical protein J1605_018944 [Eschrichtius robustus]|uniref:Solute carrier family 25 member 51 n=2 Tax=Mysticeti TaxID=9761 RepID=A0AB34HS44_ESCRO|nr:hypothetical protein J1605_018944 [Eschrichtius robustus]